ncbi:MAG: ABC transporter substrate-binding protein [Pseudomonadota bacterium]
MTRISLTVAMMLAGTSALAGGHLCWEGKTLTEGKLTIATGNPAYYPWVIDDAPESGQGFEAAVAYALAEEMGVAAEDVVWVRSSFDEAIQPGAKNFDLNMQQYSITPERDEVVDFSAPYYSAPMAVLATGAVADTPKTMEGIKGLKWGAVGTTTAVPMLTDTIQPSSDPLFYNDNADVVAAMQAGQVDAALFDLPTALYLSAVVLDGGTILGQFPADRSENPDQFGMLMEDGSELKACVDDALAAMVENGTLAAIEAEWLQEGTGVPLIE